MGQNKRKVVPVASRHLVCLNCKSWVDFKSSGCGKTWAETRGESFGFTCKGCTEVTVLVKEVEGLKQMVEDMMMGKVTRMRFEDKGEETESFIMEHENNEHWWLAEDSKGQVGYVPVSHLMIIVDETIQEEGCDRTRKEVQGKSTDGTKIGEEMGQDGGRRKTYSAAVIDGIKRNSTTYVGDSIVRKTDTRLNKGEDVVVCFPGARIEHVTERVERIMGRGKGGTILVHVGTNNADKEGTTAIVEKYRELLKKTKQARVGQIIISGILPVFGNRIDGYRNSKRMAINGMTKRLCEEENVGYVDLWDSFVGIEELYARDGLHLSGKGAAAFAEGLSGAVASGLGKVRYLN